MKKSCLAGVLSLTLVLLAGCGASDPNQESMQESGSGIQEERPSGIDSETTQERGEENKAFCHDKDAGTGTVIPEDTSLPDEGGTDISSEDTASGIAKTTITGFSGTVCCIEDGCLLLIGDRIIQMDGNTLEVQKEAENTAPMLVNPQAAIHGDICTLFGASFEDWRFKLVEYDRNLQVRQITDIEEASASERELMVCKLFSDGNLILYNNINGFYSFDLESGETNDLTQEGIFVYDFARLEETGEILFVGSDSSGKRILGRVDMDGKGLQKEKEDHLWGELWAFGDYALIDEAELVGKEKEGAVFRYEGAKGICSFPLADSAENGNITVSCGGAYYGTKTDVQGDELRYVIRIYSSEDGSMIKELPLSYEEYGENFRLRGYLICDDTGRIILYGTWRGCETDTWIVSENL